MKSLLLSILGLSVLCLSLPALAANSGQAEVPFDIPLVNPCNGETVVTSGVVHADATFTITKNAGHLTSHFNPQGVTAVGETTGAVYHATGVTGEDQQVHFVNGSANITYVNRFDFVGDGAAPNFSTHQTAHITYNSNGTLTVFFDNFSTTCQ